MRRRRWFGLWMLWTGVGLSLARLLGADAYPRDPELDVVSYSFGLDLRDDTDVIRGEAEVELRFKSGTTSDVTLDLVGPPTEGESGDATAMRVSEVAVLGAEAAPLSFEHRRDRLRIELSEAPTPGEVRRFRVRYAGRPADGLLIGANRHGELTFFGDNWPDRARHWLPTVDHPSDKARCTFIVTAPASYQVVANGTLAEETDLDGGRRRTVWRSNVPLATKVMVIGVARFAVLHEGQVAGVPLQSWVFPQDRELALRDLSRAAPILRFFVERLGPFPYSKLANVQSTIRFGGMENASSIFYRQDRFDGSGRSEPLIAHEIAHQWFGDSLTEADWHHIWLSEGFATYLSRLYLESAYGAERLALEMEEARQTLLASQSRSGEESVIDESIGELGALLGTVTYQKGAWVLHMLRRLVGEETLWRALSRFHGEFRHGNALTSDFQRIVEELAARDLGWFFEQWLWRPGIPRLSGEWCHDEVDERLRVRVSQGSRRPYRLDLEIGVSFEGSRERIFGLELGEAKGEASFPLSETPRRVRLDPRGWLLFDGELVRAPLGAC